MLNSGGGGVGSGSCREALGGFQEMVLGGAAVHLSEKGAGCSFFPLAQILPRVSGVMDIVSLGESLLGTCD